MFIDPSSSALDLQTMEYRSIENDILFLGTLTGVGKSSKKINKLVILPFRMKSTYARVISHEREFKAPTRLQI